jgi:hypothetical protein
LGLLRALLRAFSYLFHGLLALFLFVLSVLALAAGPQTLHLDMLPFRGATLAWILLGGSIFAGFALYQALRARLRTLWFVWSLAVAVLLIRGYIFSGYHFAPDQVANAFYLIAGSLIALLGSWFTLRARPRDRRLR